MIKLIWGFASELWSFFAANFDPWRDSVDILLVTLAIYWLLLLIRGTRAVQILVGLVVLIALSLASELFQFSAVRLILEYFLSSAVLVIIVLFQHDIRRALARVGRGFFPSVSAQQESQIVEEVVRAAGHLAQKRIGALIVLERESSLSDQIEAGTAIDAEVSKDLLVAIFTPNSPLHDGAVLVQGGRVSAAGCILPLSLSEELPDGLGTRHRAAIGISEETDALVIVVSEERGSISIAMNGELLGGLDSPRLRVVLRDILSGGRRDLADAGSSGELGEAVVSVSQKRSQG